MDAKNGGFVVTPIPMNTSHRIKLHQCNNQEKTRLYMSYLDKSQQTELIIAVLWLLTMAWDILTSWQ
jgi:hypothetical protein